MRELKFLVGLGTILIVLGIYSFKAAFSKTMTKEGAVVPLAGRAKTLWLVTGTVSAVTGVFLVVKSLLLLLARQH